VMWKFQSLPRRLHLLQLSLQSLLKGQNLLPVRRNKQLSHLCLLGRLSLLEFT
jgi:hypothetical protein